MSAVDTIVVGAGSAGCVLAARLSDDPARRVLLLEAGPDHVGEAAPEELRYLSRPVTWPYDWGDQVETIGGRRLVYGRGRGVGGSSATNGAVALRPEPEDLGSWPADWRWEHLLPSLNAIERDLDFGDRPWHGAGGPVPIVRWPEDTWTPLQAGFVAGCVAVGLPRCPDHNEPGTTGVGPIPMNRVERRRVSAADAFLGPVRDRPNLTVRADAHVRRLRTRGTRVHGVELQDGTTIDAGEVILAAGVVQDPLLLQRSGIGAADRVQALGIEVVADLPAVGRHLTDHAVVTYAVEIDAAAVPADAPTLQTIARVTVGRHHDLQITPFARRLDDDRRALAMSVSLQLPDGEGEILATGPEATDPPLIRWPFTGLRSNLDRLAHGWRIAARIGLGSGLVLDRDEAARHAELDDEALRALVTETHTAFYHGVGTCRMGSSGDDSVVDDRCRVHGLDGLRIVDAAIIPSVPRSNTNLAVMAVADRYARLVEGESSGMR